jgi:hypothetical protein
LGATIGAYIVDVDTKKSDCFAVGHTGSDHHAKGRELQKGKHTGNNDHGKEEVNHAPIRIHDRHRIKPQPDTKVEGAVKSRRCWRLDWVGSEEILDDFLKHDRKAKCDKNLVRVGTFIKMFDQTTLDNQSDGDHDWYREHN